MKNSTAPNRKTGRMIAKNLIVLFTVALAGFCGIQAWFTDKSSAEADGINVECQAPDGIKIAVVKHNDPAPKDTEYTVGNIKLNKTNCKFLENLQLTEITSDGTDFYKPALIQTGGQAQVDTKADWSPAAANQHYLSFDLYIRSKSQYNISIGKKSTIKPDAPQLTTQDGTGIKNKSKYGNFSRDSVVGAVRFSVVDYKSAPPSKKLLWLPAPNILLEQTTDVYTLSDDKENGDSYSHVYYNTKKEKKTVSSTDVDSAFVVNNKGFVDGKFTYELGKNKSIAELKKSSDTDTDPYYGDYGAMVTCNMWIEGEDAEARLALVNGKFKVNLVLTKES
ncbi:MAG: hypothetical protein KH211_09270 [Ruminococcus sp.]|nr:hypothetical protein [Ruminococcus sp.]MBS6811019.1 hypothetical protein [Ruminococcus sp.]